MSVGMLRKTLKDRCEDPNILLNGISFRDVECGFRYDPCRSPFLQIIILHHSITFVPLLHVHCCKGCKHPCLFNVYSGRPHLLLTSTIPSRSKSCLSEGDYGPLYNKLFVHTKSSQYKKLKTDWKQYVYLAKSNIQVKITCKDHFSQQKVL